MENMDDQPVTRTELLEALAAIKSEILDALAAQKAGIIQAVRDAQTEVLTAFLSSQEVQSVKFQHLDADLWNTMVATRKRMEILEQRLAEIEKKILPPPPVRLT